MKLFLSWSGEQSKAVASALRGWLQLVVQRLDPFLSSHDIEIGTSGLERISDELELADAGIFCLNKENFTAPWINFEAGAVSKHRGSARVCSYLVDIEPLEITGPLSKFQHARANKVETLKMLQDICRLSNPPLLAMDLLGKVFEKHWPDLEAELNRAREIPLRDPKPDRDPNDKIEEILAWVRIQQQRPQVRIVDPQTQALDLAAELRRQESLEWGRRENERLRMKMQDATDMALRQEAEEQERLRKLAEEDGGAPKA